MSCGICSERCPRETAHSDQSAKDATVPRWLTTLTCLHADDASGRDSSATHSRPEFLIDRILVRSHVSTSVDHLVDTHKLRCRAARRDPGGGGINVARVAHRLGADCVAVYLAGGTLGRELQQHLDAERVPAVCIGIGGDTRENFTVKETATGHEYRFVLPGPVVTDAEWQRVHDYLDALHDPPRYVVLSGSLPPGVPASAYAQFATQAAARGARVVVDTSGPALAAALEVGVYLVKPSLGELRALVGRPLADEADWRRAASELVAAGRAEVVALTLGAHGAMLATADGTLRAPAWPVPVKSAIDAGDSFVAAMVYALARGAERTDAFRYALALAAASATLQREGTAQCDAADVAVLHAAIRAGMTIGAQPPEARGAALFDGNRPDAGAA